MTVPARYEMLSLARSVNMGDDWYDIAHVDHFWIRRRFDVLRALCESGMPSDARVAEIGCGSGLVQHQFEHELGVPVDGFDLNVAALDRNPAPAGRLYCYDIHERNERLRGAYDLILLLDVIEHVEADDVFVADAAFLLRPGGQLIINVPASPWLRSRYDEAAGHLRRYTSRGLLDVGRSAGLDVLDWSYWGLPLLPLALARKLWMLAVPPSDVIRAGFEQPSPGIGRALNWISRLEPLPQKGFGTSLMAVFRKGDA